MFSKLTSLSRQSLIRIVLPAKSPTVRACGTFIGCITFTYISIFAAFDLDDYLTSIGVLTSTNYLISTNNTPTNDNKNEFLVTKFKTVVNYNISLYGGAYCGGMFLGVHLGYRPFLAIPALILGSTYVYTRAQQLPRQPYYTLIQQPFNNWNDVNK